MTVLDLLPKSFIYRLRLICMSRQELNKGVAITKKADRIAYDVRYSFRTEPPTSGVARVLRAIVQRYVMGPLVTKQLRNSFVFCQFTRW